MTNKNLNPTNLPRLSQLHMSNFGLGLNFILKFLSKKTYYKAINTISKEFKAQIKNSLKLMKVAEVASLIALTSFLREV